MEHTPPRLHMRSSITTRTEHEQKRETADRSESRSSTNWNHAVTMTTANAPVNLSSDAKDAKLSVVRYLHRLSELEVEGNDAHALQPGGEAGPAAAAARILITQRTGTVERVHHREARPPAVPPVILRPSIPEEGTDHGTEGGGDVGAPSWLLCPRPEVLQYFCVWTFSLTSAGVQVNILQSLLTKREQNKQKLNVKSHFRIKCSAELLR